MLQYSPTVPPKGPYLYDVRTIVEILDPFPPCHTQDYATFLSLCLLFGKILYFLGAPYPPSHCGCHRCMFLKFMLKRKDLTRETLNATDEDGDSPLLKCAKRNSRQSVYRVFVSKNVKGMC